MALSPALWGFGDRSIVPLLPLVGQAKQGGGEIWVGLPAIAGLIAVLIFPNRKWILAGTSLLLLIYCLLDLNRLQPWLWFGLLMFTGQVTGVGLKGSLWVIAGMYCWSGFNKINPHFVSGNFPWFCDAFEATKEFGLQHWMGYSIAVLEMILGLGMLSAKTRKLAAPSLIAMHVLIVIFLMKLQWNFVVIPWNVSLAVMLALIIKHNSESAQLKHLHWKMAPAIALAWLCPIIYFFHCWPYNLSWQLYSNTQAEATFYVQDPSKIENQHLKELWPEVAFGEGTKLFLDDLSTKYLRVPMFVSDRTCKQYGEYLCRIAGTDQEYKGLFLLSVDQWVLDSDRLEDIPCK